MRRELLKLTGQSAIAAGFFGGCTTTGGFSIGRKSLQDTLSPENYARMTKRWDKIYGPPLVWFSRYGGRANFEGHLKDSYGTMGPGTDYDIGSGTPLVPAVTGYVNSITRGRLGALILSIRHLNNPNSVGYGHLDDILLDYSFNEKEKRSSGKPFKVLQYNEIVALLGNSGEGPKEYGGIQPPHLHVSLLYFGNKDSMEFLDFEKYGLDGGKPIFGMEKHG